LPATGLLVLDRSLVVHVQGVCSFCDRNVESGSGALAARAARAARICDECVGLAVAVLEDERLAPPPRATPIALARALAQTTDRPLGSLRELEIVLKRHGLSVAALNGAPETASSVLPACSFCDALDSPSALLIAGSNAASHVCEACIADAAGLFSHQLRA
jgi:hypothetical protein